MHRSQSVGSFRMVDIQSSRRPTSSSAKISPTHQHEREKLQLLLMTTHMRNQVNTILVLSDDSII
eukprot:584352-Ditylum_brightwellii.AAC.1